MVGGVGCMVEFKGGQGALLEQAEGLFDTGIHLPRWVVWVLDGDSQADRLNPDWFNGRLHCGALG